MPSLMITSAFEYRIAFLFEKWNETYQKYGEVNLAKEKAILCQKQLWSFWLSQKAERCGA